MVVVSIETCDMTSHVKAELMVKRTKWLCWAMVGKLLC